MFCNTGGKARVFNASDIKAMLTTKKSAVTAAMAIMVQSRDLAEQMGISDDPAWARISGILDSNLMMHVWAKSSPSREAASILKHIAEACYNDLVNAYKERASNIPSPWATVELASEMAGTLAGKSRGLRELNSRGVMSPEMLQSMGFAEGQTVKTKPIYGLSKQYEIASFGDGKATLVRGTVETDKADGHEKKKKIEVPFHVLGEDYEIDLATPKDTAFFIIDTIIHNHFIV